MSGTLTNQIGIAAPEQPTISNGTYTITTELTSQQVANLPTDFINGYTTGDVVISEGVDLQTASNQNWYLFNGSEVIDDGDLYLTSGAVVINPGTAPAGSIVVGSTGTLELSGFGTAVFGALAFQTTGGEIILDAGEQTTILGEVANVQVGNTIVLAGVDTADSVSISTVGTVTNVSVYSGTTLESHFTLNDISSSITGFSVVDNGSAAILEAICFLEGTAIATPDGETAVEALQVGDLVTTVVDGKATAKPVTWLGHRSVKPGDLSAQDAHPVRIKANAFAEGMPKRDLLVTAEHCILVDGGLIPARLLVNGSSIIFDTGISSFTYYHVELEQHSILLAEGLTTESYLDTGNRGRFANADVTDMRPHFAVGEAHQAWENAAAPLTVDVAHVKPVWEMLSQRAQELGIATAAQTQLDLSSDPDLHLVLDNGVTIRPVRQMNDKYMFMLPPEANSFRLVSHTARPSDITPYLDDRRDLGVLVGAVSFYEGRKKIALDTHLKSASLQGWFGQENDFCRWTNGNAVLPIGVSRQAGKAAMLEVQVVNAGPYLNTADAKAA